MGDMCLATSVIDRTGELVGVDSYCADRTTRQFLLDNTLHLTDTGIIRISFNHRFKSPYMIN